MTVHPLRGARLSLLAAVAAALLLSSSCAPVRPVLGGGEREEAARFFRGRWLDAPFPARASYSGTVATDSGRWPILLGVEALAPERETAALFSPFGQEVVAVRNDGERIAFRAGPLAGPLTPLDGKSFAAPGFSLGRLFSGAPAFEPKDGEYSRGEGGEWVYEGEGQTLRSDPGRKALASALYRLHGQELSVSYPGWEGAGTPPVLAVSGRGVDVTVRRDEEP